MDANQQQNTSSTNQQSNTEALAALLDASGVDAATLATALQSIAEVKQSTAPAPGADKSIYQEKELVYDDEFAYIYRRGDTKRRIYYLRIYDTQNKQPYIKSLQTTDRVKAITKARLLYQDVKGKIDRGERVRARSC